MTDEGKKIVSDEDWKEQAQREKERLSEKLDAKPGDEPFLPEPTFSVFLAGLATEAYMALGEIENPVTQEKTVHLDHAKYVIDMMDMIQKKTAGNLDEEETERLEAILYDCRMRFVNASERAAKSI